MPLPKLPMTPFQAHVARWKDCKLCSLHADRARVVLVRGKLPADVCFIGEAPGKDENSLGTPFEGPAGQRLNHMVSVAMPQDQEGNYKLRDCYTNLVACIPYDPEDSNKTTAPDGKEILSCSPRLQEIVEIANPKLIVCVGRLSWEWLDQRFKGIKLNAKIPMIQITHPSAILQAKEAQKGLMEKRAILILREALICLTRKMGIAP